jgi:hypothetical protein
MRVGATSVHRPVKGSSSRSRPFLALAIHNGHWVRDEVAPLLAIDERTPSPSWISHIESSIGR